MMTVKLPTLKVISRNDDGITHVHYVEQYQNSVGIFFRGDKLGVGKTYDATYENKLKDYLSSCGQTLLSWREIPEQISESDFAFKYFDRFASHSTGPNTDHEAYMNLRALANKLTVYEFTRFARFIPNCDYSELDSNHIMEIEE